MIDPRPRSRCSSNSTRVALLLLGLLFVAGLSSSCDETGNQFSEGNNANMVVSPLALVFTYVAKDEAVTQYVTVRNEGTDTLVLPFSNYTLEPASAPYGFAYMSVNGTDSERLAPGEEARIAVTYLAPDELSHEARLILHASNGQEASVFLNSLQPVPQIQVDPNPVLFTSVALNTTTQETVIVSNVGSAVLRIDSVQYMPENTVDFTIVSGIPDAAVELQPSQTFEIVVEYSPTGDMEVADVAHLLFDSNSGGADNRLDVEIRGGVAGPRIEIEPAVVDFGALEKNAVETRTIIVHNIGEGVLEVSQIYLAFDSSTDFTYVDLASVTLNEGEQQMLTISYSPSNGGTDSGFLIFESNDPINPGVKVNLVGAWAGPDLEVRPEVLDFGQVAVGATKTLTFDVYNNGLLDLTVNEMADLNFPSDNSLTYTVEGNLNAPFTVGPNQKKRVSVLFKPTMEIPRSTAQIEVRSNDPEVPTESIDVIFTGVTGGTCQFELVPNSVNFGLVPGGYNKQMPIMVRNNGAAPCYVQSVTFAADFLNMFYGNPFSHAVPPFQPFMLDPGATALVEIDYSPFSGETDTFSAQAVFSITDGLSGVTGLSCNSATGSMFPSPGQCSVSFGATPACWACLTGKTGDPALAAVPGVADFGLVTLGCHSAPIRLRVYNKGTAPTNITSLSLSPSCNGNFSLTGVPVMPLALPAGTYQEVELLYTPTTTVEDTCSLIIVGETETLTVPIRGEGTTDEFVTDTFDQVSGRKVDVLFVVDNSGSMSDDQQNLATNFSSFIAAAVTWGVDFQLGITTMDDADEGKLQNKSGYPRIIASTSMTAAEVMTAFQNNVKVGDTGSGSERGLKAAELALSDPKITQNVPGNCPGSPNSNGCAAPYACDTIDQSCGGYNARFLRDDASLEVIFLSDEVDQSPAVLDFYVDFFKNIKGYQNDALMHAHSIVGDDSCNTSSFHRYVEVATRLGGRVEPICGNFANALANIGNTAFGLRVQFFLSRVPEPPTIVVKVNGTTQGSSAYTFDAASNAIIFNAGSVPAEFSSIVVTYKAACF
ncbi:MAG: hypothetical protein AUK47_14680 [Deltaproteobacteria bacterium CG2_30_63_29]|nr:MAG: hypothetical protein AUK47_14680 [Deltaproteobacteria bacterium CG2_30_63_29]PJB37224.1 MAG: hypothetical protein CO108_21555 [Deltaproteobacteria bacterium CG_4_9_14_3_um_filter_63_12]